MPIAEPASPKLLDRLRTAIRLRHFSPRTEEAYAHWVRRYILFHRKRHPSDMGESEVTAFLTHLSNDRHVSASTQNQALAALLFLYRHVLSRERVRCSTGGCGGRAPGGTYEASLVSRFSPFFCDPSSGGRSRHPYGSRTARSQGCEHDDGVYACAEPGAVGGQEPGGSDCAHAESGEAGIWYFRILS